MAERTTDGDDRVAAREGGSSVVHSKAADRPAGTDLSIAVVEAVAEAKGVAPTEMEETLYDAVDPDALDRLFTDRETGELAGRVVFELEAHEVTVQSNGDVLVRQTGPR
ncbi:HalOD1 output domain-containing protein [Halosimplex halophilum]|uniref:HalOD1 output domain-containing protein n=1 Tax=Halosimplex halophilum TaxID=2559572 RepID=UPI0014354A06|nr:HalOD1 output domain-containing protein [Halosimplex halophilum]